MRQSGLTMADYAAGTTVAAERSRLELEKLLRRFGADQFGYGWQDTREVIMFRIHDRAVRMELPVPDKASAAFRLTAAGRRRTDTATLQAYEAEIRRRWRSLVLIVRAKLTAVTDGISTVEREFLADVVLPDGSTIGEWAGPQLEQLYAGDGHPALLPGR
jgi:hypothetical protein